MGQEQLAHFHRSPIEIVRDKLDNFQAQRRIKKALSHPIAETHHQRHYYAILVDQKDPPKQLTYLDLQAIAREIRQYSRDPLPD